MYFTTISAILNVIASSNTRRSSPVDLLKFVQAVHQRIAVDIKLPRCLGHVQAVLEKFVDGHKRLLVEIIRRFAVKDLT